VGMGAPMRTRTGPGELRVIRREDRASSLDGDRRHRDPGLDGDVSRAFLELPQLALGTAALGKNQHGYAALSNGARRFRHGPERSPGILPRDGDVSRAPQVSAYEGTFRRPRLARNRNCKGIRASNRGVSIRLK